MIRVARDLDAHHVAGLPFVEVGGRPDLDHACDRLAVVEPHLDAHAARGLALDEREQVVADREALRLALRQGLEPMRRGCVQVATPGGADVPGDAGAAPAEVVGRGDVREKVEALLVA